MPNFALKRIEAIKGKQDFYELLIDGVSKLDEFYNNIQERYKSEFKTALVYMDYFAKGNTLPDTKFKDITPPGEKIKEYEFKSKNLRFYGIAKVSGKIIILVGYKTDQKNDIKKFRNLKKNYCNDNP